MAQCLDYAHEDVKTVLHHLCLEYHSLLRLDTDEFDPSAEDPGFQSGC